MLQAEAMVRVVEGVAAVVGNWARVGVRSGSDADEFVVALVVWVVEVEEKPRVAVKVVDRRTMDSVDEDKVARRNRALVDCIRIVLLNDSWQLKERKKEVKEEKKKNRGKHLSPASGFFFFFFQHVYRNKWNWILFFPCDDICSEVLGTAGITASNATAGLTFAKNNHVRGWLAAWTISWGNCTRNGHTVAQ